MICLEGIPQAISQIEVWRQDKQSIGLVPTMGFFHEGHLCLMRKSVELVDKTVVSIFVNPRQFGQHEDFDTYPKNLERDAQLAMGAGVDMLFCPSVAAMYPDNHQTNIRVTHLARGLCGKSRPGHFDGVATVVAKLFNIFNPDIAVFGKKDYQQLALIKQLTNDLNFNVKIVGGEIVREADGLAMSSRNTYLDKNERRDALCLSQALQKAAAMIAVRKRMEATKLKDQMANYLALTKSCTIDYIEVVNKTTLESVEIAQPGELLVVAAYFNNKVRLIDNIIL